MNNMENLHEKLKLGVKKYGYDSKFMKEYLSLVAQIRHHELGDFFENWDIKIYI